MVGNEELILVKDILKEAKRLNAGVEAQVKKAQAGSKTKKAQRRFYDVMRVQKFIGEKIVQHQMKFFGSLLKGQDFDYHKADISTSLKKKIEDSERGRSEESEGFISTGDLFKTIQSIPEFVDPQEGLREGDILDLVNDLDEDRVGLIRLSAI